MSLIQILFHLGAITKCLKDLEKVAEDLIKGNSARDDIQKVMSDLSELVGAGIIKVPGLEQAQILKLSDELVSAVKQL